MRRFVGERSQRMRNKRFVAAILSALLIFGQISADASVVYAQEKTGSADASGFEVELVSESLSEDESEAEEPASEVESEESSEVNTETLSEDESESLTTEESSEAVGDKSEEFSSDAADENDTESSEDSSKEEKITEVDTEGIHLNKYAELDPVTLVGGSDGVIYDGIDYLTAGTVARFNDEMLDAYFEMCDSAAELVGVMPEDEEIGFYATESGEIGMTFFVPFETYAEPDAALNTKVETPDPETVTDKNEVSEAESETGATVTEAESSEETSESLSETEAEGIEEESLSESEEVKETESEEQEEKITEVDETGLKYEFLAENTELVELYAAEEYEIEGDSIADIDSLFPADQVNYFRNNLTSSEKTIYDSAKKAMVNGNRNSFSYNGMGISSSISRALSALITTYSSRFGWIDKSSKGGWSGKTYWGWGRGYSTSVTLKRSKYYNASLQSKAKKKINEVVDAAYASVGTSNSAPTYALVKYFNNWLIKNNYYNKAVGTSEDSKVKDTKEYYYCHSPYGCLLEGYGVCESYAMAMSCLLDAAGVRNIYIVGTGDGGSHAWNYVLMPNNVYYLVDATWDDNGATSYDTWVLSGKENRHKPTGHFFIGSTYSLTYPTLSSSAYGSAKSEGFTIGFDKTSVYTGPKKKFKIKATIPAAFTDFKLTWSSSDTKVAKVDQKGNVTAVAPGQANITCAGPGSKATCYVCVYQFTGMTFTANSKASYSAVFANTNDAFETSDIQTYVINVNQKGRTQSAANIKANVSTIKAVTAKSTKPKVAEVASVALSGDQITLRMQPKSLGTTKVTVSFAGKKATLTLKVTRKIESGWFSGLPYSTIAYSGKANKPKITKTASAPAKVSYKVVYKNNTNAGTATVSIQGTGNYGGEVTRTFTITPLNLQDGNGKIAKMTKSAVYTGAGIKPSVTVKYKNKTLKAGKDYVVYINNTTALPVNAASYTVKVIGNGNYVGTINAAEPFVITKAPITKLSVSCKTTVKFVEGGVIAPVPTVKIGKNVIGNANYSYSIQGADGKTYSTSYKLPKGKYKLIIKPEGNVEATKTKKQITKAFTVK